jgi:predicted ABC-type ATPase
MSKSDKRVRMFAGPNGSGKTTLFKEFQKKYPTGCFINADEFQLQLETKGFIDLNPIGIKPTQEEFKKFIASSSLSKKAKKEGYVIDITLNENFIVDKSKHTHAYEAALCAAFVRDQLIKSKHSFSFETVMSHPSKLKEIKEAKETGYKTYLYFIATDNPEINESRVQNRVVKGGHDVMADKIYSRYIASLELLSEAIKLVDRAYLFDNSGKQQQLVLEVYRGEAFKVHSSQIPSWIKSYVLDKFELA